MNWKASYYMCSLKETPLPTGRYLDGTVWATREEAFDAVVKRIENEVAAREKQNKADLASLKRFKAKYAQPKSEPLATTAEAA